MMQIKVNYDVKLYEVQTSDFFTHRYKINRDAVTYARVGIINITH